MRSQFLTLLCILTFLSCTWGLFDSAVSFFQTDAVSESTYVESSGTKKAPKEEKKANAYFEDRSAGDGPMPSDPVQVKSLAIAQFVYSLLTLIGTVLMFQLRRVGFWVYVAGVVVGLIMPVTLAGFGALNTSFGVFFSMIFAGLYWVSLKEMQ